MNRTTASDGRQTLNGVCCAAPILLSIMALTLVAQGVIQFGGAVPVGAGAHDQIFQLLISAQVPLIALFAFTADWTARTRTLRTLAIQVAGWFAAIAAVGAWEWLAG